MALQLRLKFDETSGTFAADSSGNGYAATLNGGMSFSSDVPSALTSSTRSVECDGVNGSRVTISDANANSLFSGKSLLTVCLWLNPLVSETNKVWLEYGVGASKFSFEGNTSALTFYTNNGAAITTSFTAATWAHVALRLDGTNKKIYKNGTEVQSTAFSAALQAGTGFVLGGRTVSLSTNSRFDDLRIYDHVLTPTEIATLAAGGEIGSNPIKTLLQHGVFC